MLCNEFLVVIPIHESNHQAQILGKLGDTTHCHLGGRPPYFRLAVLWHKGNSLLGFLNLSFKPLKIKTIFIFSKTEIYVMR